MPIKDTVSIEVIGHDRYATTTEIMYELRTKHKVLPVEVKGRVALYDRKIMQDIFYKTMRFDLLVARVFLCRPLLTMGK